MKFGVRYQGLVSAESAGLGEGDALLRQPGRVGVSEVVGTRVSDAGGLDGVRQLPNEP